MYIQRSCIVIEINKVLFYSILMYQNYKWISCTGTIGHLTEHCTENRTDLVGIPLMPRRNLGNFIYLTVFLSFGRSTIGLYRENAIAIESEARDPNGSNGYNVTMCNLHCDVVHITTVWVSRLGLDHAIAAI